MGRRQTKSRPEPLALTEELLEAHEDEVLVGSADPGDEFTRAPEPADEPDASAATRAPRRRHVGLALIVVYVLIVNVLAGLTAYFAIKERDQALLRSQHRAASMARVMEEHLARSIGETERALQAVATRAHESGGLADMAEGDAHRLIKAQQSKLPQSRSIAAVDPLGRVVASTAELPVRRMNLADQGYVASITKSTSSEALGRPIRDPFSGNWSIPLSIRVESASGSYGGLLVAFIDPAYFADLFREFDLPRGATVSVIHATGRLLAHFPATDDTDTDTDLSAIPSLNGELKKLRAGSYTETGPDGVVRQATFRRPLTLPLVVSVAVPLDAALEPWEQSTLIAGLGAAVLGLFVGIILLLAYHELHRRAEAEAALRSSNQQLEERIRQRTAALEQSNRQLAAFSYSVSHDLRAPLRAINGFCQALEEDYGPALDKDGVGYLKRVRRASERMGELIDSMVELTSLSRASVRRARTDLTAISRDIANELTETDTQRQVTFDISPDLVTSADSKLVRILLAHLLDNAWKFTRETNDARISVGATDEDGHTAYFVDDNGIGFDMTHAAKLFTPFHRLHPSDEYEGFGIGLATAKHIVELHGGHMWADAVPGRGVAIHFTLFPNGDRP